ncbi:MAG TPA: biotin--[acetyl-CoA-carboxylase] ligase [Chthoniobacterales bacterium]|nr:biotin--[acetyl-CoA-carboxylase] ligase [Chthoniobacterales bacterium]
MPARDRLRAEKLRGGFIIGRDVVVLEETESTNDVVAQMSSGDWPEGFCVFAEHQIAGRGQHGKQWASAAGKGLWFSILLRPGIDLKESARLTNWVAGIIAETLQSEYHVPATVRPPNDVYINERKVAGVLVEMRAQPGASHVAVVGIGLNVNHAPSDFPDEIRDRATSVAIVYRGRLDRNLVALALLRNLDRTYRELFQ